MKKWILITAVVMFAAGLVLGTAYVAWAQGGNPPVPFGGPGGMMRGWMHSQNYTGTLPYGRGPMMGGRGNGQAYTGTLPFGPMSGVMMAPGGAHEQVWTAVAKELGLTYDQLQEQLKTKTLAQLAQEKGVTLEKLQAVSKTAHQAALDKLVEEGKLTREQADWMLQRIAERAMGWPMLGGQGYGPGSNGCPMLGGTPSQGFGSRGQGSRGRMMPFFGGRQS